MATTRDSSRGITAEVTLRMGELTVTDHASTHEWLVDSLSWSTDDWLTETRNGCHVTAGRKADSCRRYAASGKAAKAGKIASTTWRPVGNVSSQADGSDSHRVSLWGMFMPVKAKRLRSCGPASPLVPPPARLKAEPSAPIGIVHPPRASTQKSGRRLPGG
ncbi:hypothetical protein G7046_g7730 [Stylonectria norvegica]|nr:hypothetical protein G7046_g7730 [Stylonectria norvegica]